MISKFGLRFNWESGSNIGSKKFEKISGGSNAVDQKGVKKETKGCKIFFVVFQK